MKEYAEKFYKSKRWQKLRQYVWSRDRGLCQRCLKNGKITEGSTIHHIVEITQDTITDENITLNPDNLITLCRDCHAAVHKREKRYTIDEFGRVTPLSEDT